VTDGQTFCHGIVRATHTRRTVTKDFERRYVLLKLLLTNTKHRSRGFCATAELLVQDAIEKKSRESREAWYQGHPLAGILLEQEA